MIKEIAVDINKAWKNGVEPYYEYYRGIDKTGHYNADKRVINIAATRRSTNWVIIRGDNQFNGF